MASAENGRIALDMLRSEPYDLMLLNMEMPELDGFGVLEHLVAEGGTLRDLPVIVTSSLEGVAHVVRCLELGADKVFDKSNDIDVLIQYCILYGTGESGASEPAALA